MRRVYKRIKTVLIAICFILPIQTMAVEASANTEVLDEGQSKLANQDRLGSQDYIGKVGLNEALVYTQTYGELAKVMFAYYFIMNSNYCIEQTPRLKDKLDLQTQSLLDEIIYFEDANFRQTSDYHKPLTNQRSDILLNVFFGYGKAYNDLKNQTDSEQYCLQYANELEKEEIDIKNSLNQALTTIELIANNAQQAGAKEGD